MSSPDETPNGVDRLAQVAGRKSFYDEDGEWVYLSAAERDALVEIAKAARDVLRIVERDTTEVNALRAALVRLDSGAAEGDA